VLAIAARLAGSARAFARAPLLRKVAALAEVRARLHRDGEALAWLGCEAKGLAPQGAPFGEELLAGSVIIQRYVRLLGEALTGIRERGAPFIPDERVERLSSGEVSVEVVPNSPSDRALFLPYSIHVRLAPEVDTGELRSAQASFYQRREPEGAVAAVLGGGNVASIPALDLLHQCFVEGRACLLKMSPVNAYLGPLFERIFAPIAELGGLAIVYGGVEAGKAMLSSPDVAHVHMTGAIETHDAIVWGPPGPERVARMQSGRPLLQKSISSELGNISPVIVVPGPYTESELTGVAESVAGMLFNNASFNCNAAKLLVVPKSTAEPLLARLEQLFAEQPVRTAYYPGAIARYRELTRAGGEGRLRAQPVAGATQLPWSLLTGLTPESEASSFQVEPFCPLLTVVEIDESGPEEFLDAATRFVNEKVWGSLNAMLFVPREFEDEPSVQGAIDRAVEELRYGVVAINYWPAVAYGLGTPPWGGHPSASLADAQSGLGFVHNSLMLENVRKVVLRGPLWRFPKQVWIPSHRSLQGLARSLFDFESTSSPTAFLRTAAYGLRG